jgi:hypothetical protein
MEEPRQDLKTDFRAATEVVGFGRIWPCISRDAMRSKAGVKQLRTVRLRFAASEGA